MKKDWRDPESDNTAYIRSVDFGGSYKISPEIKDALIEANSSLDEAFYDSSWRRNRRPRPSRKYLKEE